MDVNFAQVLTTALVSVVVAAASAWFAGTLGVKRALEQAKQQKAFDRRLESYERTYDSIRRLRLSILDFVLGRDPGETAKLLKALQKSSDEVDDCVHEAMVFAERIVIKQLVSLRSMIFNAMLSVKSMPDTRKERELVQELVKLNLSMREINRTILQGIRVQLGLDEITAEDLETESEKKLKQITTT